VIAFESVRTTASCPTTSLKVCGRYLRYRAAIRRFKQIADAAVSRRAEADRLA
jgi:hypothetical protein